MATPMGLLGGINEEEMQQQAMKMAALQAGLTGLMASGPSLSPVSTGQVLGQMGLTGVGAYQQGLQQARQQQVQKQIQQATQSALGGGQGGAKLDGAAMADRLDALATSLLADDPQKAKYYKDMAEKYRGNIAKYTGEMANLAYTKFGTSNINDLTSAQRNELDQEYQQRKLNVAARQAPGAPVIQVKYGESFGTNLAKQQVDMINTSSQQARGAAETLATVNEVEPFLDEAFTGPGANVQIAIARIGEKLGLPGANESERLKSTSALIKSAAQLELDAASKMAGQGSITGPERDLLRRAASIDPSQLTATEIKEVFRIIKKSSTARITGHNATLDRFIETMPEAKNNLELFRVVPPVPVRRVK